MHRLRVSPSQKKPYVGLGNPPVTRPCSRIHSELRIKVRFGLLADIWWVSEHVRFDPDSGRLSVQTRSEKCQQRARREKSLGDTSSAPKKGLLEVEVHEFLKEASSRTRPPPS